MSLFFRSIFTRAALLACFGLMGASALQAQSSPEETTRQWLAAFNAGDMAKAATFNSPAGTSIIDEFPPYAWNGPKAFDNWAAGFDADAKAKGITEPKVTMGAAIVNNSSATDAYLVFPAVYTYKQKGVSMRETGRDTVALRKENGAWKIVSWCWTGTVPKPVLK